MVRSYRHGQIPAHAAPAVTGTFCGLMWPAYMNDCGDGACLLVSVVHSFYKLPEQFPCSALLYAALVSKHLLQDLPVHVFHDNDQVGVCGEHLHTEPYQAAPDQRTGAMAGVRARFLESAQATHACAYQLQHLMLEGRHAALPLAA